MPFSSASAGLQSPRDPLLVTDAGSSNRSATGEDLKHCTASLTRGVVKFAQAGWNNIKRGVLENPPVNESQCYRHTSTNTSSHIYIISYIHHLVYISINVCVQYHIMLYHAMSNHIFACEISRVIYRVRACHSSSSRERSRWWACSLAPSLMMQRHGSAAAAAGDVVAIVPTKRKMTDSSC